MPVFTPTYGWPFQALTDPPDGPNLGEDLALAIEATMKTVDSRSVTAAGNVAVIQSQLATQMPKLVARGRRTSNQTSAGAESGILRIDFPTPIIGHAYYIFTSAVDATPSAAGLAGHVTLRLRTDGVAATNASTQIAAGYVECATASAPRNSAVASTIYVPVGGDVALSIFMGWLLVGGAGTITANGGATTPIELFVMDMGVDVGTSLATVL